MKMILMDLVIVETHEDILDNDAKQQIAEQIQAQF